MRIAKTIGKVVLSRCHPSFQGANLKLAVPYSLSNLDGTSSDEADTVVVWDELGTGTGSEIGLSEGPEAAQPFRPNLKPVDAYAACLLDAINLDQKTINSIKQNK